MESRNISFGSFQSAIPGGDATVNFRKLRAAIELAKPSVLIKDGPRYRDGMTHVEITGKTPRIEEKVKQAINIIIENGEKAYDKACKLLRIPQAVREEAAKPKIVYRKIGKDPKETK